MLSSIRDCVKIVDVDEFDEFCEIGKLMLALLRALSFKVNGVGVVGEIVDVGEFDEFGELEEFDEFGEVGEFGEVDEFVDVDECFSRKCKARKVSLSKCALQSLQ